jgi:GxxExxY protein
LLESVYEKCFIRELQLKGLNYVSQRIVPLNYKGIQLDADLRFDVLVEDMIVTELKAMEGILPVHEALVKIMRCFKIISYLQVLN